MSTGKTNTGGVRDLRAIFEKRANDLTTTPAGHGRLSTGSTIASNSKPLSRVRTSFVAVGRLARGGPSQLGARKASNHVMDNSHENNGAGLGVILKGSAFEDLTQAKPSTKTSPLSKPTQANAPKLNGVVANGSVLGKKIQDGGPKPVSTKPTSSASKATIPTPTQNKGSPTTATMPMVPKPRGGPAKIKAVMESAQAAREARAAAAPAQDEVEATKQNDDPKLGGPTLSKPPRASLPARIGRPTGSATAPTASFVAKTETPVAGEAKPADRKTVVKGPPRVANATTASSLAKKSSRASIGGAELSKPRVNAPRATAGEGFLARMTRPTASSAQKTHEKVQTDSPPRQKATAGTPKSMGKKPTRASLASVEQDDVSKESDLAAVHDEGSTAISDIPEEISAPAEAEGEVEVNGSSQVRGEVEAASTK